MYLPAVTFPSHTQVALFHLSLVIRIVGSGHRPRLVLLSMEEARRSATQVRPQSNNHWSLLALTEPPRTSTIVNTLMVYAINTGLLTRSVLATHESMELTSTTSFVGTAAVIFVRLTPPMNRIIPNGMRG